MAPNYVSESEVEERARHLAHEIADAQIERLADKMSEDSSWHLDRRIPIGIIFAVAAQTLAFIVIGTAWKVGIEARIDRLEQNDNDRKPQEARLIRLEEKVGSNTAILRRIEDKIESVIDQPHNGLPRP